MTDLVEWAIRRLVQQIDASVIVEEQARVVALRKRFVGREIPVRTTHAVRDRQARLLPAGLMPLNVVRQVVLSSLRMESDLRRPQSHVAPLDIFIPEEEAFILPISCNQPHPSQRIPLFGHCHIRGDRGPVPRRLWVLQQRPEASSVKGMGQRLQPTVIRQAGTGILMCCGSYISKNRFGAVNGVCGRQRP